MHRSQCITVSGVKGSRRKLLKFLIQALLDVALFQLVKATFLRGIFSKFSGANSGRTMDFYFKKLVNFFCLSILIFLFTDPIMIFETPSFIMTKSTFIC
jgi:hypothetical protein